MFMKILHNSLKNCNQIRNLSIQEHAAQCLLNEHGITTPKFGVAKSAKDAEKIAKDLLTKNLMVKAQVLAGGRGLGYFDNGFRGGVQSAIR
jgi:succinyl-CoA synthetase beta subunit